MLKVITGPMFSGKSSKLITLAANHIIANHVVLAFKPSNDNRYDEQYITTHAKAKFMATSIDLKKPEGIFKHIDKYEKITNRKVDVVIIDEAQFFKKEIINVVEDLLYKCRKTIILSGLSQDSSGNPFGAMPYFLAIADDIIHLKAVCSKSKTIGTATRTFRKDVTNTNQVAVGGSEMYEPRSFDAWLESRLTL